MLLGNLALPMSIFCYRLVYKYFSASTSGNDLFHPMSATDTHSPQNPNIQERHRYSLLLLLPTLVIFFMGGYINSAIYGNTIVLDYDGMFLNGDRNIINTSGNAISMSQNLIHNTHMAHFQILAIQVLGMASLFCVLYAYKKLSENFQTNARLALLEQESYLLQQYVAEAKMRYEKTKSFRHDVKNHVTIVTELLQNHNQEEALHYLNDMEPLTADFSFPCNTNHPTVDILLENKLGIAKNEEISVSCSLKLPCPCSVKDIDFCIILSNALDNAIHACREMDGNAPNPAKYIHVDGTVQGDFILVKIQNSFSGAPLPQWGAGLSNIQAVAEKYHGTMEIITEGTDFELNVLLINSTTI